MVAPNGARKNKDIHPELPITINEIVRTAIDCYKAGADAIHAHVRDEDGKHILDSGLYIELNSELSRALPKMKVQITTEAVGQYSPQEQRQLVKHVAPKAVSVALREMVSDNDISAQREFYFSAYDAKIDLQHIIYTPEEMRQLADLIVKDIVPSKDLSILFVLGRYAKNQISSPDDILPFLAEFEASGLKEKAKFMVCAFGQNEQACLIAAAKQGSDCRIGFENNHFLSDGSLALDNAGQVGALVAALDREKNL
jgi:uncharacterized protein (DUF849 family)